MPLLNFNHCADLSEQETKKVAEILTQLTATHLKKKPHLTAVAIQKLAAQDWFVGASSVKDAEQVSFSLRIAVTQGTNSEDEIRDYIGAVYEQICPVLGAVREESYIIVDQVPAFDWGYGGLTQGHRALL